MTIVVNGKEKTISENTTLTALITAYNLSPQTMIVELNGEVVKREAYDTTVLSAGNAVELVQFVGGG